MTAGQIAFVDTAVADYQTLLNGLDPNVEVVLIHGGNGLQQMADTLAGRQGLDAVYVISHGSAGQLRLGDSRLDATNLSQYQAQLAAVGGAVTDEGDLLLYGCEIASGAGGVALIEGLAQATGADVAASDDLTGAAALGGDWELEIAQGSIEASQPFSARALQDFTALLAPTTYQPETFVTSGEYSASQGDFTITAPDPIYKESHSIRLYAPHSGTSSSMTVTVASGKSFQLTNLAVFESGDEMSWESLSLTGYLFGGGQVSGTITDAVGNTTHTVNLSNFSAKQLTHFKVAFDGNSSTPPFEFLMDSFTVDNVITGGGNAAPAVTIADSSLSYTENAAATQIDASGTVYDADGDADWIGGSLKVQITAGALASDELSIADTDGSGPAITVSGTNILADGLDIGDLSLSGGKVTGNTALTITFDADATDTRIEEVLQSIRYRNTGEDPGSGNRTVTFTVTDKNAATGTDTRTIAVTPANDVPFTRDIDAFVSLGASSGAQSAAGAYATALLDGISLEAWIYLDSTTGAHHALFNGNGASSGYGFYLVDGTVNVLMGSVGWIVGSTGSSYNAGNAAVLSAGRWTHIAATRDTDDLTGTYGWKLYVDGEPLATQFNPAGGANGNPISLGANSYVQIGNAAAADAAGLSISEARIWEKALTPAEIQANMSGTVATNANGLVGYWKLEQSSGGSFNDIQTNKTPLNLPASGTITWVASAVGTTNEDTALTGRLAGGDLETGITYAVASNPAHGTVIISANGAYTYTPAADYHGSDSFTFTTNDGSDTSAPRTVNLTINPINDAPALSSGPYSLTSTDEDTTSSGTLVSTLLAGLTYADVDTGANSGIAITATVGSGTWQYSTDGTTWNGVGTVGATTALLLSSTAQVRYVPDGTNGETATLTFRAWDQTSGTASTNTTRHTADPSTNGGSTAFSAGTAQASITVSAINDAPTLSATAASPTFTEDGSAVALFSGATASTVESGQTFKALTLTLTNVSDTTESLSIDGSTVDLINAASGTTTTNSLSYSVSVTSGTATVSLTGGTLSAVALQTLIDGINYSNSSNTPTTAPARVVTLTGLQDSGGTANGGVDSASLSIASTVTVVDNPTTLTSATFDWQNGAVVLTGTDFIAQDGAANDIDTSALTFTGVGGAYTLTDTSDVEISSNSSASITLSAEDLLQVRGLLNANGTASGGVNFLLTAADDWLPGAPGSLDLADADNTVTVSNVQAPSITSATYDSDTGVLSVTGSHLFKKLGASNDIDLSMLTFTGGTGNATYTLTTATDVEITSATSFSATLSGADKTAVDALLDQIGGTSSTGTTYNLAAGEDWLAGADPGASIADATSPIMVSSAPRITSATYDASTGVLVVTGSNIQANSSGADIDTSKLTLTGEGGATYTLTDTSDVERDSISQFTLTLSATDRAAVNQMLNKNGTSSTGNTPYNLAAADDWNTNVTAGDTTDASNGVTVSNVAVPSLTSATYDAATGTLVLTGAGFLKRDGAANDIVANTLTLTAEGGATYTLTDTASVEITSGTSATLTLSETDKAAVNLIVNKNGTRSTGGTTYNIAAAEDWSAGADPAVVIADTFGNGVTASNIVVPTITSATYNAVSGVLVVTGTGFLTLNGSANDIDASKITFTGQAGGTRTLTDTADVDITSATRFTLTLSATDKTAVNLLINKNGTQANDSAVYNLAAAEDWAAGADAAVVIADLAGNGITATVNTAPSITSNGGGDTAAIDIPENSTAVTTFSATDGDSDAITYSITGGADQARFSIINATGALTFTSAPNFEAPTDSDSNNTYVVDVTASDGKGGTDVQTLTVTVTDVNEVTPSDPTPVTPPSTTIDGTTVQTTSTTTTVTNPDGTTSTTSTTTQTVAPVTATRVDDPNTPNSSLADIPLVTSTSGSTLLSAGLPVGVGLQVVQTTSTGTTMQGLIQAIEARTAGADQAADRDEMTGVGNTFLQALPPETPLVVRTLIPTIASGVTQIGTPIVLTGSALLGGQREALVIDTRNLPSGTVIQLDNVEFAAVVGAVRVTGGAGSQVVTGDANAQYIVLGEDNDVLYGGGGDDTVGSEGGNDRIFGNAGNDTLFGGEGEDLLHGGADTDVATFTGSISRYEIVRDHGKTIVRSLDRADDVDTVINVETLRFDDADYTVENAPHYTVIASLYGEVLDRQADLAGFQYWAERYAAGESMGDIALSFLYSAEYQSGSGLQFSTLSTAAQLDLFYLHFLGRTPDEAGHAYWMNRIEDGMSLNDVAHSFVVSTEMQGVYVQPTAWEFLL